LLWLDGRQSLADLAVQQQSSPTDCNLIFEAMLIPGIHDAVCAP
jgi:hypothetical protein